MWRNPMPWKNSPETPNISTLAQTDDMRPGLGWDGLENLESFVKQGGVLIGVDQHGANSRSTYRPDEWREREHAGSGRGGRQPAPHEARG